MEDTYLYEHTCLLSLCNFKPGFVKVTGVLSSAKNNDPWMACKSIELWDYGPDALVGYLNSRYNK